MNKPPAGMNPAEDELALARMDDDGYGCAITAMPPGKPPSGLARLNRAYVRLMLRENQPGFAAALMLAEHITEQEISA